LPQDLMPALYRAAHALVFPSTKEGFGLVVLEAMASGVPVVTSCMAPFTEYIGDGDALWCNPFEPASISAAMAASFDVRRRECLIRGGRRIAARHDWAATAQVHIDIYDKLREPIHA